MSLNAPFKTFKVLFLGADNSARSILAEALLNRLGAGRFEAYSAGFKPVSAISPFAYALLNSIHYKVDTLYCKSYDTFIGENSPEFDFIFRMTSDIPSHGRWPDFKGDPMVVDWFLPDPGEVMGSSAMIAAAYADVFGRLANRIDVFCQLPLDSLSRMALNARLERMGEEPFRLAS